MALTEFRNREKQLKSEGQFKPDMVAFKELREKFLPKIKHHGSIEGVPVGLRLRGRGEAAILGIHQKILNGIDSVKDEACFAVCISCKLVQRRTSAVFLVSFVVEGSHAARLGILSRNPSEIQPPRRHKGPGNGLFPNPKFLKF